MAYVSKKHKILDKEMHGGAHNAHYRCKSTRANQVKRANVSEGAPWHTAILASCQMQHVLHFAQSTLERAKSTHSQNVSRRTLIQYMPGDTTATATVFRFTYIRFMCTTTASFETCSWNFSARPLCLEYCITSISMKSHGLK